MTVVHWGIFAGPFVHGSLVSEKLKEHHAKKVLEPNYTDVSDTERNFIEHLLATGDNTRDINIKQINIKKPIRSFSPPYSDYSSSGNTIYIGNKWPSMQLLLDLKKQAPAPDQPILKTHANLGQLLTKLDKISKPPLDSETANKYLNQHTYSLWHEYNHRTKKHQDNRNKGQFFAPFITYIGLKWLASGARSIPFIAQGLAKAAQHVPSTAKELLKIPSGIAKGYLTHLGILKCCRLQEQQADNLVPDNIEILKGGIACFKEDEKNLQKRLRKSNTLFYSFYQTPLGHSLFWLRQGHPSHKQRVQKFEERIKKIEQDHVHSAEVTHE